MGPRDLEPQTPTLSVEGIRSRSPRGSAPEGIKPKAMNSLPGTRPPSPAGISDLGFRSFRRLEQDNRETAALEHIESVLAVLEGSRHAVKEPDSRCT